MNKYFAISPLYHRIIQEATLSYRRKIIQGYIASLAYAEFFHIFILRTYLPLLLTLSSSLWVPSTYQRE